ncbi:MAG: transposase [Dermatophilaceae bacterium]
MTEVGPVSVDVPRDRAGTFTPVIVPRGKRRLEGDTNIVLSLTDLTWLMVGLLGGGEACDLR